jgi:DNA-binding MarR family transcriptional regulator
VFAAEIPDLTPRQFAVLVAVASNEGASQTELVEKTGADRSTLADIVKRLCRKGLLPRSRTREDARAYAVKLADQGRRVLSAASPVARRVDDRVLGALPAKQRKAFLTALASIVEKLQSLSRSPLG